MPHEEPVISPEEHPEQAATEDPTVQYSAVQTQPGYEPIDDEQDDWLEEPQELPRRPRRRLLGSGGHPVFLALLAVLLIACGFIGGVLIEKGETSSSSSTGSAASGLASRFRSLRGGTGTGAAAPGGTGAAAGAGGFTRPTAGTVSYLAGSTLYVTNSEGNTIKVDTSAGTTVTKTVKAALGSIHPGETVTVTGATGSGGSVSAESISVGASAGGGLAGLFGGAGAAGGAGGSGSGSGGSSTGGGAALFGSGG